MGRTHRTVGNVILAGLLLVAPERVTAQVTKTSAGIAIIARWYSESELSNTFKSARRLASNILDQAGIGVSWRECISGFRDLPRESADCDQPPRAGEIVVRIVPITPEGATDRRMVLGSSIVDPQDHGGTFATVYADRVIALARAAQIEVVDLLARVITHEIGHLLLGTNQHAPRGIMRAEWSIVELHRDAPLDWLFSGPEGRTMKVRIAARLASDSPWTVPSDPVGTRDPR